jgi:hypothetical protein
MRNKSHSKRRLPSTNYVYRSDEGRWGCLTSGDRWDFYFLRKKVEKNVDEEDCVVGYELFELVDVKAHGEDGMSKVMGTYHRRIRLNV